MFNETMDHPNRRVGLNPRRTYVHYRELSRAGEPDAIHEHVLL